MPKIWQCESVKTRHDRCAFQIDLAFFARNFFASSFEPTKTMRSTTNRDSFGVRLSLVHGVNISVYENEVDILGRVHAR